MSKKKPEWEELEIIVTKIQKQLAPEADVRHNHRVVGKSGRRRKLDVTISQKVSSFPVFIVFDCKRHSKSVKLKDVAAFAMQIEDVDATLGVMVSSSGFDAGAKAIAKQKKIILQTFRKAGETDWKDLVGEGAWSVLTKVEMPKVNAFAVIVGNPAPVEVPFDTPIRDENGETPDTLKSMFWDTWKQQMGQPIGEFNVEVNFEGLPSFVRKGDALLQIQSVTLNAKLIAKKYLVNLNMAEGNIIEDDDTTKPVYRSIASKGFDWAEIMNNQPGIEISHEEYQQILRESKVMADLSNAKQHIRILAVDKGVPEQTTS